MDREEQSNRRNLDRLFGNWPIGIIIVTGALSSLLTLGGMSLGNQLRPAPIYIDPPQATAVPGPTPTPEPISVFVNGQVAVPEIYVLPFNSKVDDAITAAGGFTVQAHTDIVNLAQPLTDGMQVYVPSRSEIGDQPVPLVSNGLAGGSSSGSDTPSAGELVNLNAAGKSQLETLPGVGPSTAQKILDYREDNGSFGTIEEVMNVSGIGPSKFEQMAPYVTVSQ